MQGKIIRIDNGCFNDIITIKLDDGTRIESRGFDIGLKGVPLFTIGDKVLVTAVYNELSKCYYARKLEYLK